MRLRGRGAIITGASRGLGRAIAARLLREGASVVLAARDGEALRIAAEELTAAAPQPDQQVVWQAADVSRPGDAQLLVKRAHDSLGHVDILVCNAAILGPLGAVQEVDWDDWVRTVEINLFGAVLCCRAVLPTMRQQGSGKIIILSGGGATRPQPRMSAYAASKAAVVRFAETLAEEVSEDGIEVNAVAPGALNTRFLEQVLAAGPDRVGAELYQQSLRQKSDGGADPDLAAELVAFLASSESDGISGRLISALWDEWRDLPAQRSRLAGSDVYTLRRVVPEDRGWRTQP